MIEIEEVARLYPAQTGKKLIVGKFNDPYDRERTAAEGYFHLTGEEGYLYYGETMQELCSAMEGREKISCSLIESILSMRKEHGLNETTLYQLNSDLTEAELIR